MSPRLLVVAPLPACRRLPVTQRVPAPTLIGCELLKNDAVPSVHQLPSGISGKEVGLYIESGVGQQPFHPLPLSAPATRGAGTGPALSRRQNRPTRYNKRP